MSAPVEPGSADHLRLLDIRDMLFERPDPEDCLPLQDGLADEVRGLLGRLGHGDGDLDRALAGWAGVENLEARLVPGRIDPLVLDHLRAVANP